MRNDYTLLPAYGCSLAELRVQTFTRIRHSRYLDPVPVWNAPLRLLFVLTPIIKSQRLPTMPPKRKADALEGDEADFVEEKEKKPRKSRAKKDAPEAGSSKDAGKDASKPQTWKDVKLPGEDDEVGLSTRVETRIYVLTKYRRTKYRCST